MQLFYEIVQVALEKKEKLSHILTEREWRELLETSLKQAVAGVTFLALDKLSDQGQKLPVDLLLEWIGLNEQIRQQNSVANKRCAEISSMFADAGYDSCILKGQGNTRMYPVPESRTSGDIDIWVFGERAEITRFVKERCPEAFEQYHHIDFPIFDDIPVEVHYMPGSLMSPKYNNRFQKYCRDYSLQVNGLVEFDGFKTPSVDFNAVYQMAHIMIHFFIEGIGLRHFVDYYYVLTNTDLTNRTEVIKTLRWLGMEKFVKGVMWIEQYCMGLEDEYLLFEPSEKAGRVILKEMEEGGNFGHHDERYSIRNKGVLARGLVDGWRLLRLAAVFPSESFWKIMKKIENQKWKFKN